MKNKLIIAILSSSLCFSSISMFKVTYGDTTKVTEYYKNGSIKKKGTKVRNFKDGYWYLYSKEGKIVMVEHYKNGKLLNDAKLGSR